MTYLYKLRRTNLGKFFYGNTGRLIAVTMTALIVGLLLFLFAYYANAQKLGYTLFNKHLSEGMSTRIEVDSLTKIITDTENDCTYCIFTSGNSSGVVLLSNKQIDSSPQLSELLKPESNTKVVMYGMTMEYSEQVYDFIARDRYLAYLPDVFGEVYLNTMAEAISPMVKPICGLALLSLVISLVLSIISAVRDGKLLKAIAAIEDSNENGVAQLNYELMSTGNFAISDNILLTENYLLYRSKYMVMDTNSVKWCYINMVGGKGRLVLNTVDGKHYTVFAKNKRNTTVLNVLYAELCSRGITLCENTAEDKAEYKRIVSEYKLSE